MEQEKRLLFLKQNATMLAKDTSKYAPVDVVNNSFSYRNVSENSELIYDHRFLTWNAGDIDKYFKSLTLAGSMHRIADELNISEKTVRNHISNAMQKLGCKGRAGAVIELLKLGEISL